MPKKNIDYSNTIIYKIYCKNTTVNDIYVGHTTNFIKRKYQHKIACNKLDYKLKIYNIIRSNGGWENWDMTEIATYNCKNHTEARIKEQEHYKLLKCSLNSKPPYINKSNLSCEISKDTKDTKKTQNNKQKFFCEYCDFNCFKLSDWNRHLSRPKHLNNQQGYNLATNDTKKTQKAPTEFTCKCGKTYQYHSGLWRHKKLCTGSNVSLTIMDKNTQQLTPDIVFKLIEQNKELQQTLMDQNKKNHHQ